MTKRFCDLCGKPAMEHWPILRVDFPDKVWSGIIQQPHHISPTEGTWTPYVEAAANFVLNRTKTSIAIHNPDICESCVEAMLRKMADSLVRPPNHTADLEATMICSAVKH